MQWLSLPVLLNFANCHNPYALEARMNRVRLLENMCVCSSVCISVSGIQVLSSPAKYYFIDRNFCGGSGVHLTGHRLKC